jgi:hypothetical protein
MTNIVKGLLTNYGSTSQVELSYYFVVSGNGYVPKHETSSYFFIGRVQPWDDENNPQTPSQSQIAVKTTFKNMIAAKLLTSSNMSPVVRRIDWESGTVYDEYKDIAYQDMLRKYPEVQKSIDAKVTTKIDLLGAKREDVKQKKLNK